MHTAHRPRLTAVVAAMLAVTLLAMPATADEHGEDIGETRRVSLSTVLAEEANDPSDNPSLSADGRFVAFDSRATNLVPSKTTEHREVYVRDRQTGATERVSVPSAELPAVGDEANGSSSAPAISGDGRFVAFLSEATNLVAEDTNLLRDVFVHDRETGATERVSVSSDGAESDEHATSRLAISADGRFVAWTSRATSLVGNADERITADVYLHDRQTAETTRVSQLADGTRPMAGGFVGFLFSSAESPSLSADGRFVAFTSGAPFVTDKTHIRRDAFVLDRQTGGIERVSVSSAGEQTAPATTRSDVRDPSISADGGVVAFSSGASNLVEGKTSIRRDVFVHDRALGETSRVSVTSAGGEASAESHNPSISADGRTVAFESLAINLVPGKTTTARDVFVHDLDSGETVRVSVGPDGQEADNFSSQATIASSGRMVGFVSPATNLVADDTNGDRDVFVHDLDAVPCPSGERPNGVISGRVRDTVEPNAGPAAGLVRDVNCEAIVVIEP